jgi:hypothetical protein
MEYGLTDKEIMRLDFFVRCYGTYERLEAAIGYSGAGALDHAEYVVAPAALDQFEDTIDPSLEDQSMAMPAMDDYVIEKYMETFDSTYNDLHIEASAELTHGVNAMRSLIVNYFPREANKDMLRQAFTPYGQIDSVYLVHKDGKPACYGFVNFHDHASAARAMVAASLDKIELVDKRDVTWHVKAEWTTSSEIPKKPKKKRSKKDASETILEKCSMLYPSQVTLRGLPKHAKIAQALRYTVPSEPPAEVYDGTCVDEYGTDLAVEAQTLWQCDFWDPAW